MLPIAPARNTAADGVVGQPVNSGHRRDARDHLPWDPQRNRTMPEKRKPASRSAPPDWRDGVMQHMRALIEQADPRVLEERKWKKPSNPAGVAVWSHDGIICTGEIYKDKVKLTFMHGAVLPDPAGLFNAPFTGATRRAIDIREGGEVDAAAFKSLVKAAVAWNGVKAKRK